MKAIVMKEFGGPEVLKYVDVPDPVPEANEVLIKLAFCGVNPNETYVRTGTYNSINRNCLIRPAMTALE